MSENDVPPNPYKTMNDDEMKKNFTWMAEVLNERSLGLDYHEVFKLEKATISAEDKKKLEQRDKFLAMHQQVMEEIKGEPVKPVPDTIDPNLEKIAKANVDSTVREIKEIDKDIPIDGIVNGDKSIIDKLDILNHVKEIAVHHGSVVKGLRDKINIGDEKTADKFTNVPNTNSWTAQLGAWQKQANSALGVE